MRELAKKGVLSASRLKNKILLGTMMMVMGLMYQIPVLADEAASGKDAISNDTSGIKNDLIKNAAEKLNDLRGDIVLFGSAAIGVVIAICAVIIIFSKNERAQQGAWSWGKRAAIAFVVLISLSAVYTFIKSFAV